MEISLEESTSQCHLKEQPILECLEEGCRCYLWIDGHLLVKLESRK